MATLPVTTCASPLDTSDNVYHTFTTGANEVHLAQLNNMPSDFASMDTVTITVEASELVDGDDILHLTAKIVASDGTTRLAGGSTDRITVIQNSEATTTDTVYGPFTFSYVNTTATKADWDGAQVWLEQGYSQQKSADNNAFRIDYVEINGTYTTSGPALPVTVVSKTHSVDASLYDPNAPVTEYLPVVSDRSGGTGWSTAPFYEKVDEIPIDDGDFINNTFNGFGGNSLWLNLKAPTKASADNTSHKIVFRAKRGASDKIQLQVALLRGSGSNVEQVRFPLTLSYDTYEMPIPAADVDAYFGQEFYIQLNGHTGDSLSVANTLDVSGIYYVYKASNTLKLEVHSVDSILSDRATLTHSTDAFLAGKVRQTHQVDAFLTARNIQDHAVDAFLTAPVKLFPVGDDPDVPNSWTTAPLWEKIDEFPIDDADYITSDSATNGFTSEVAFFADEYWSTPYTNKNHKIVIRAADTSSLTADMNVEVTIINGGSGTYVGGFITSRLTNTPTTYTHTLSDADVGRIEDYTNLTFKLQGNNQDLLASNQVRVYGLYFEVPSGTGTRQEHYVDSVLLGDSIRTHSVDAFISDVQSKTHSVDGLLYVTKRQIYAANAVLLKSTDVSHNVDYHLTQKVSISHATDALTLKTSSASQLVDAMLVDTTTLSHSADALLLKVESLGHSIDAVISDTLTVWSTVDALIELTAERTYTADAILLSATERYHSADATLQATQAASHSADAHLLGSKSDFAGAYIAGVDEAYSVLESQSGSGPSALYAIIDPGIPAAESSRLSYIQSAFEVQVTHGADAFLLGVTTQSHSVDSVLLKAQTISVSVDAVLLETTTVSHGSDALISGAGSKHHGADAILKDTFTHIYTVDALIQSTTELTYSVDASLLLTSEKTHAVDASLELTSEVAYVVDAVIQVTSEKTHSADASILLRSEVTHLTDAVLQSKVITSHAVDAALLDQIVTSAGAYMAGVDGEYSVLEYQVGTGPSSLYAVLEPGLSTDSTKFCYINSILDSSVEHSVDALLEARTERTYSVDGVLRLTTEETHSADSVLLKSAQKAHSVDSIIGGITASSHNVDTILRKVSVQTYESDAVLREVGTRTLSADAVLKVVGSAAHKSDATLQSSRALETHVDALLSSTATVEYLADASLLGRINTSTHAFVGGFELTGLTSSVSLWTPGHEDISSYKRLVIVGGMSVEDSVSTLVSGWESITGVKLSNITGIDSLLTSAGAYLNGHEILSGVVASYIKGIGSDASTKFAYIAAARRFITVSVQLMHRATDIELK